MALQEVEVRAIAPGRLGSLLGPERAQRFETTAATARALLEGRAVVNVNSTATGGGVAELLQTLLAYARGAGVDVRWVVIEGDQRFFEITKRIHNHLYGTPGDGGPLGEAERRDYEKTLRRNLAGLLDLVRAGDVVVLHDPQTAGLAAAVRRAGRSPRRALSQATAHRPAARVPRCLLLSLIRQVIQRVIRHVVQQRQAARGTQALRFPGRAPADEV